MSVSLLVAYTKKGRVIGSDGKIPWNIPSERFRFKKLCNQKFIIMGRKSFDEIGHALSYCTIIIVSKSMKSAPEGCMLAESFEKAMEIAKASTAAQASGAAVGEILIAGGEEIYRQALPFADKIYATEIHTEFAGNRFFPELDKSWHCTFTELHTDEQSKITYEYKTFEK
ncbi:MAG: dihydrofolate reductase [Treponema sp.]|nr:dihydrofolate reductase [Treponema sp.]